MNLPQPPHAFGPTELDSRPHSWTDAVADQLDFARLIAIFRRRLRLFLAAALVVFVAAVLVILRQTPLYTATADLMIDVRQERIVNDQAVLSDLQANDAGVVDTEVEILR